MKNALMLTLVVIFTTGLAAAQTTKLIFGPRDGDNAGVIEVDINEVVEVDVWIRTAPNINIIGFHLPLSTNNLYIQQGSQIEGDVYYPLTL